VLSSATLLAPPLPPPPHDPSHRYHGPQFAFACSQSRFTPPVLGEPEGCLLPTGFTAHQLSEGVVSQEGPSTTGPASALIVVQWSKAPPGRQQNWSPHRTDWVRSPKLPAANDSRYERRVNPRVNPPPHRYHPLSHLGSTRVNPNGRGLPPPPPPRLPGLGETRGGHPPPPPPG